MLLHKPRTDICGSERKAGLCASMAFDSFRGLLRMESICRPPMSLLFWARYGTVADTLGTLWMGIQCRKVDHFSSADGLSSNTVFQFYEDREGNLWAATSNGIDCFSDVRVASFSTG